jgi:hypothetical protein
MRFKMIALPLVAFTILGVGLFVLNRNAGLSKASGVLYTSTSPLSVSKYEKFQDLDCLSPQPDGEVRDTFVLRKRNSISPKGVPVKDYLVALKVVTPHETFYDMQAVAYRNGVCRSYYSGFGDEVPHPLSRVFEIDQSREIQLIWERWKLENISGWREKMQKRLNRPLPMLSDEEVWALKQLGYKMPKKWQEVK